MKPQKPVVERKSRKQLCFLAFLITLSLPTVGNAQDAYLGTCAFALSLEFEILTLSVGAVVTTTSLGDSGDRKFTVDLATGPSEVVPDALAHLTTSYSINLNAPPTTPIFLRPPSLKVEGKDVLHIAAFWVPQRERLILLSTGLGGGFKVVVKLPNSKKPVTGAPYQFTIGNSLSTPLRRTTIRQFTVYPADLIDEALASMNALGKSFSLQSRTVSFLTPLEFRNRQTPLHGCTETKEILNLSESLSVSEDDLQPALAGFFRTMGVVSSGTIQIDAATPSNEQWMQILLSASGSGSLKGPVQIEEPDVEEVRSVTVRYWRGAGRTLIIETHSADDLVANQFVLKLETK